MESRKQKAQSRAASDQGQLRTKVPAHARNMECLSKSHQFKWRTDLHLPTAQATDLQRNWRCTPEWINLHHTNNVMRSTNIHIMQCIVDNYIVVWCIFQLRVQDTAASWKGLLSVHESKCKRFDVLKRRKFLKVWKQVWSLNVFTLYVSLATGSWHRFAGLPNLGKRRYSQSPKCKDTDYSRPTI